MSQEKEIQQAEAIISMVVELKGLPKSVLLSGCRKPKVSYLRSLAVYCILTSSMIKRHEVSRLLNMRATQSGLHYCYHKLKRLAAIDENVREDIKFITDLIRKSA